MAAAAAGDSAGPAELPVWRRRLESLYLDWFSPLADFLSQRLPPGPQCVPMRWVINFQKGGTLPYVLALMTWYNHWGPTAWLYAALHGSYGLLWLMKDQLFPDANWERRITLPSAVMCFLVILGPYWMAPWLIARGKLEVGPMRQALCVFSYVIGVVLMMAADTQKYFQLRERRLLGAPKRLLSDGWFSRSRNPNYLGEMLVYGGFAGLCPDLRPWLVLAYVWTLVFGRNILQKEQSLRRKPGFAEYESRSGLLLPDLRPELRWLAGKLGLRRAAATAEGSGKQQ